MSSDVGRRRLLMSWSGGKDSALALVALASQSDVEIVGLLTSVTSGYDRVSIHGVRRELLEAQARALQLPLTEILLEPECTNDAYEAAFLAAVSRAQASHGEVDGIAFGDLFLEDVRQYRERLLASTELAPLFPLWGESTEALAARCIALGIEARLVCVDTTQLAPTFAGRLYDAALLADLRRASTPAASGASFTRSWRTHRDSASAWRTPPAKSFGATNASFTATCSQRCLTWRVLGRLIERVAKRPLERQKLFRRADDVGDTERSS